MNNYNAEYQKWLSSAVLTDAEKNELNSIANDEEAKALRFSAPMDFGTAGLRSTMYMGIGCMNRFTVAQTTRGIAALVKAEGGEKRGVAIAYDSRNNSREFARVSACVLAGAGVKSYIFDDIRPTPELSFAVRQLGTLAGINITASHNPKEYNGYKAYWEDGAQISPEQAKVVSAERAAFDVLDMGGIMDYDEGVKCGLIVELHEDFDELYLGAVLATAVNPDAVKSVADDLKVVYSPLHGAGYKLVPEVFKRVGLKYLYTVDEQMTPDGNFPTVEKPNPEYKAVFSIGIELANKVGSDLIIATDPDSDRVGVMTRTEDGSFKTISGNQMGALLLDYVIKARRDLGILPANAYCVKSLVSTDMAYKIATDNGVKLHDVLTGFKFIGEVIKNYEARGEADGFLLGFEESYGYLLGSYARDKDAVEGSMMILEMTAYYKKLGMTLSDALAALYKTYGLYSERTIDIYMEGLDGIANRKRVMQNLRDNIPTSIGGVAVKSAGDYKDGSVKNLINGEIGTTGQPSSDVLYYTLVNDDKIIVRPSGTEPKIKIYVLAHGDDSASLEAKVALYEKDSRKMTEV
ncbi:MAG: phospho-sugar mutase [Ruminococcaceae bacterium]|nr:phospho-sugar mutase [Oscillospiraceae bacterium]